MVQSFHVEKKFMQTICTKRNTSTEKFLPPPMISNGPPLIAS